jgi:hypothetical protein
VQDVKKMLGLLGVAAACGLCCALPLALPLLGGFAVSGLGITLGWEAAALSAAAVAVGLVLLARRRQARACARNAGPQRPVCECRSTGTACQGGGT